VWQDLAYPAHPAEVLAFVQQHIADITVFGPLRRHRTQGRRLAAAEANRARQENHPLYYQLDVDTLAGILQQRTSEEGKSDVLIIDDFNLQGKKGTEVCNFLCNNLDNMRKRHLVVIYVAFDYIQDAGVTVTFRNKFSHVFWFCHPNLATPTATKRAEVLNVVDPVYGPQSPLLKA
jgi:hypothetical protein